MNYLSIPQSGNVAFLLMWRHAQSGSLHTFGLSHVCSISKRPIALIKNDMRFHDIKGLDKEVSPNLGAASGALL